MFAGTSIQEAKLSLRNTAMLHTVYSDTAVMHKMLQVAYTVPMCTSFLFYLFWP